MGAGELPGEERRARALLTVLAEPGDPGLSALLAEHGAEAVVSAIRDGSLTPSRGGPSARRIAGYRARLADGPGLSLEAAQLAGIRLVCPGEPEWPQQLDDLASAEPGPDALVPPYALWVRGAHDLRLAALRSVAVIGARAATPYGEHVAGEIGALLAERGWTVVSGAAYGIDAAAHRSAMAAGGTTIAVLACGVDQAYPRAHELLLRRIADEGVLVSELPPGASVTRSRLLQRNRLVAALTRGTVVVEAAVRSGTATTARQAGRLGRTVMAVPGPVTSSASVGCHELIRDARAVLVTDGAEVAEAVGLVGEDLAARQGADPRPEDSLSPTALRVLDALPARSPWPLARVVTQAALPLAEVRTALASLLDLGLAEHLDEGWRVSAVLRSGRRPQSTG